jgi:hypothetical protein
LGNRHFQQVGKWYGGKFVGHGAEITLKGFSVPNLGQIGNKISQEISAVVLSGYNDRKIAIDRACEPKSCTLYVEINNVIIRYFSPVRVCAGTMY